ncbi:MAG: (2Fe-2S)-binding protein [Candidatus Eremiobacteraeota bacterium]|nr:(2Fe-2S)-binding protein [Candidatus Eremiobacteraeota bacterium]
MSEVDKVKVRFEVNGEAREVETYPMARLLDVLREQLRLTGAKEGCGEGECGSCSVLLDGQVVNSCLIPILQLEGRSVTTIEALGKDPLGRRIQESFLENNGAQCGICTPGMLMASYHLLKRNPNPNLEEIKDGLAGNLCRCTGYKKIFDSVAEVAKS